MQKIHKLHVHGMHCNACVTLTESELKRHSKVSSVKSDLKTRSVEICGDFGDMSLNDIAEELSGLLSQHKLSTGEENKEVNWGDFKTAVPVALVFMALFIGLQKMGIVNIVNASDINYGTAFVIGVIASLSTCMAVVGGLVLSMSATFAQGGDKIKPQLYFHAGRIVSFFLLGGVIGIAGSAFQVGIMGTFVLGLLVGLVMLVLGINLLDVFHWTKKLQPAMPKFLSRRAMDTAKLNHTLTPALVGLATFFLPCGFTQSMQIFTLTTGGFMAGGLTMLAFALGTLPVLLLVSFSSFSINNSSKSGIFFKSAGLIVIMFAILNIINSLVVVGLISPVFNPTHNL